MDWRDVVLFLTAIHTAYALICLQCKGISQPRHCKLVDKCYQDEVCGVERLTNTFGDIIYNVGCIVKLKCQNSSSLTQGSNAGSCKECCQTDLCNAQGCGQPGYPGIRGPICFDCPLQTNPDTCHSISICEKGDVCKYKVAKEFGDIVYTSGCSSLHECTDNSPQGPAIIGRDVASVQEHRNVTKRSLTENVCEGCCYTDLCNGGCNGTTHFKEPDYCSPSPCVHGNCVNSRTHYTCICPNTYVGQRCEIDDPPTDCFDIFDKKIGNTSGVYSVKLWRSKQTINVYCDMDTFPYGWTVFQNRFNGSVDFYRNFSEYTNGFGNLHGEFWLGLNYIQEMASQYENELRVDLTSSDLSHVHEIFMNFSLAKYPNFTLNLGQRTVKQIFYYRGDGLTYNAGYDFSTFDHDVDVYEKNCAELYHGGWWYHHCAYANLNGEYITPPGGKSNYTSGMGGFIYYEFSHLPTLKASKMMFRKHT